MTRNALDIIIRPLLTEKLTEMREAQHKIGFLVRADANKVEIKNLLRNFGSNRRSME